MLRWRNLRHQTRVTIISFGASAIVLAVVLYMTASMLTRSATDNARRQMHGILAARLQRDKDMSVQEIIDSNHDQRDREKRIREGNFVTRSGRRIPPPPSDPALRPRIFFSVYTNNGEPLPDFIPPDMSYGGKTLPWPATLSDVRDLPSSYTTTIEDDAKGRFKVLGIYDVRDQLSQLRRFDWALLMLWPVMVGLLTLATYLAIGRSFQPLHKLLGQGATLSINDRLTTADQAEFGDLAASINSYLDRIEKVVRQQEEFAVDAAHELSTPLTALRGQLELAIMEHRDAQGFEEAAKNAIAQVTRLQRLVDGLLLATRPRDGATGKCDVQQMLEEVQARWVDRYAANHVNLELSAEAFRAAMPEEEIESVMENLLANALKFSPRGSTVRVTLDSEGQLIVQDQGPGIPEDDRERVFERFERGTTKARGFGIGLYLVRRLLEQRGGSVRIGDSQVGARIEVALPA